MTHYQNNLVNVRATKQTQAVLMHCRMPSRHLCEFVCGSEKIEIILAYVVFLITTMLLPDLLNILFDQSDYHALVILASLKKRCTAYANKYSLLSSYNIFDSDIKNIKNSCHGGYIKQIKQFIDIIDIETDKGRALRYSVVGCHLNAVKFLIEKGANVHVLIDTPLRKSASCGAIELVKYLVSVGADINARDGYPLACGASNGHISVVKYLVGVGANIHNNFAVGTSVRYGHIEVVKYFASMGVNIHEVPHVCEVCALSGNIEMMKYLMIIGTPPLDVALRIGAEYGHLDFVKYMVSIGANVRYSNGMPLRMCSKNGHLETVKYLVEVGADVHARDDIALRRAAESGHLDVVKYLVGVGANVHAVNENALICGVREGHKMVVKYLVSVGADVHAHDEYVLKLAVNNRDVLTAKYLIKIGANVHVNNVLHHATYEENIGIVECLVIAGANVDALDVHNDSALMIAAKHGCLDIVMYLVSVGANIHIDNDKAYRLSVAHGHDDVAAYLASLK